MENAEPITNIKVNEHYERNSAIHFARQRSQQSSTCRCLFTVSTVFNAATIGLGSVLMTVPAEQVKTTEDSDKKMRTKYRIRVRRTSGIRCSKMESLRGV